MIDLILLFEADQEIQRAFNRYEEFQPGRGELSVQHLDAALTRLCQQPEIQALASLPLAPGERERPMQIEPACRFKFLTKLGVVSPDPGLRAPPAPAWRW